jgi:hypothetical protein
MSTTNDKNPDAANHSTFTASTTSVSTISPRTSSRQSIMDAANSSLASQISYDYLRDGKFGRFPKTKEWKDLSDRHKTQNKAFTHFEGIIEHGTVDKNTIQDGITLDFAPAAKKYFKKSWESPDIDTTKLAAFSKTLISAVSKPIYQDARNIPIKLAQTTPEFFNENWSYYTGYITDYKKGKKEHYNK